MDVPYSIVEKYEGEDVLVGNPCPICTRVQYGLSTLQRAEKFLKYTEEPCPYRKS
jgi:hypothetical protein